MITKNDLGISQAQWDAIANATGGIDWYARIYPDLPRFEFSNGSYYSYSPRFDAVCVNDVIYRVRIISTDIVIDYIEAGDLQSGDWTIAGGYFAESSMSVSPSLIHADGIFWLSYVRDSDGTLILYRSTDFSTWTQISDASTRYPRDIKSIALVRNGVFEITVYYWSAVYALNSDLEEYETIPNLYNLRARQAGTTSIQPDLGFDTGLYWQHVPYCFSGISTTVRKPDGTPGDRSVNILTLNTRRPSLWSYEADGKTAKSTSTNVEGLLSFTVTPSNGGSRYIASDHFTISEQESPTGAQLWRGGYISAITNPVHGNTLLVCASVGSSIEHNSDSSDTVVQGFWWYVSVDGRRWSQAHFSPLPPGASREDFPHGVKMLASTDYVYLVSGDMTLASYRPGIFGYSEANPRLMDITSRIEEFSVQVDSRRMSSLTLANADGLMDAYMNGSQRYVMELGVNTPAGRKIISLEDIEAWYAPERVVTNNDYIKRVKLTTVSYSGRLSRKVKSEFTVNLDNTTIGRDIYPEIPPETLNTAFSHTAVMSGDWRTYGDSIRGMLSLGESDFERQNPDTVQSGLMFSTFKSEYENGTFSAIVRRRPDFIVPGAEITPESYFGIVFRARDKDNFWRAYIRPFTNNLGSLPPLVVNRGPIDSYTYENDPKVRVLLAGYDWALDYTNDAAANQHAKLAAAQALMFSGGWVGIRLQIRYGVGIFSIGLTELATGPYPSMESAEWLPIYRIYFCGEDPGVYTPVQSGFVGLIGADVIPTITTDAEQWDKFDDKLGWIHKLIELGQIAPSLHENNTDSCWVGGDDWTLADGVVEANEQLDINTCVFLNTHQNVALISHERAMHVIVEYTATDMSGEVPVSIHIDIDDTEVVSYDQPYTHGPGEFETALIPLWPNYYGVFRVPRIAPPTSASNALRIRIRVIAETYARIKVRRAYLCLYGTESSLATDEYIETYP